MDETVGEQNILSDGPTEPARDTKRIFGCYYQ
jgi:hypothetical protein